MKGDKIYRYQERGNFLPAYSNMMNKGCLINTMELLSLLYHHHHPYQSDQRGPRDQEYRVDVPAQEQNKADKGDGYRQYVNKSQATQQNGRCRDSS